MLSFSPPFHGRYVVYPRHFATDPGALFETIQITNSFEEQEELIRAFAGARTYPGLLINGRSVDGYENLERLFRGGCVS